MSSLALSLIISSYRVICISITRKCVFIPTSTELVCLEEAQWFWYRSRKLLSLKKKKMPGFSTTPSQLQQSKETFSSPPLCKETKPLLHYNYSIRSFSNRALLLIEKNPNYLLLQRKAQIISFRNLFFQLSISKKLAFLKKFGKKLWNAYWLSFGRPTTIIFSGMAKLIKIHLIAIF